MINEIVNFVLTYPTAVWFISGYITGILLARNWDLIVGDEATLIIIIASTIGAPFIIGLTLLALFVQFTIMLGTGKWPK